MNFLIGAVFAFLVVAVSERLGYLTVGGAIAAFFIGWVVFALGKLSYSFPILVFFISASFLSKLGYKRKLQLINYSEKSSRRNSVQVLANGLLPTIFLILGVKLKNPTYPLLYLATLASASADTWATEIGVLSGAQPRSAWGFRKVQPGESGGISFLGTAAAVCGASVIATTGFYLASENTFFTFTYSHALFVATIGVAAQVMDSIFGTVIQAKYLCAGCGKITEKSSHCFERDAHLFSGWKWINNDFVNLLSSLVAALMVWLGTELFFLKP